MSTLSSEDENKECSTTKLKETPSTGDEHKSNVRDKDKNDDENEITANTDDAYMDRDNEQVESPPNSSDQDEKICRICFGGPDDEENGKLFSPCRCSGSMRYVHTGCLTRWRRVATGATSFWKCDQCGFKYHLERTRIAGLAQNNVALVTITIVIFLFMVFVAGYIAAFLLSRAYAPITGSLDTAYSSTFTDTITEAARVISDASGTRVHEAVRKAVPVSNKFQSAKSRNRFFTSPYSGGRSFSSASPPSASTTNSPVILSNIVNRVPFLSEDQKTYMAQYVHNGLSHFILGLSFLGIVSFIQLLISLSLLGPLHHFRNPLMRGIRRSRDSGNSNFPSFNGFLVVVFVIIGILKAFYSTWKLIGRLAKWTLVSMENAVLEVNAPRRVYT